MTEPRQAPTHTPMSQFRSAGGELLVNAQPISRIAARVGHTPFYAYDRSLLDARVAQLRAALPAAVKLHYAMKANPMPALVCHMARLVDGIDVASAGELLVALDAGADPQEISFAGPGKTEAELHQAVAAGILSTSSPSARCRSWLRHSRRSGYRRGWRYASIPTSSSSPRA